MRKVAQIISKTKLVTLKSVLWLNKISIKVEEMVSDIIKFSFKEKDKLNIIIIQTGSPNSKFLIIYGSISSNHLQISSSFETHKS